MENCKNHDYLKPHIVHVITNIRIDFANTGKDGTVKWSGMDHPEGNRQIPRMEPVAKIPYVFLVLFTTFTSCMSK